MWASWRRVGRMGLGNEEAWAVETSRDGRKWRGLGRAWKSPGEPVLISWEDASTLFHEFGHALHGLSSNVSYPTLAGTNVARDYVEIGRASCRERVCQYV